MRREEEDPGAGGSEEAERCPDPWISENYTVRPKKSCSS